MNKKLKINSAIAFTVKPRLPHMICIEPIPAFDDNYIWCIIDQDNRTAAVVDPGDAQPVLKWMSEKQLELTAILVTHHHPDHTGGISTLLEHFSAIVYGPNNPSIPTIQKQLQQGDSFNVLGLDFNCLEVPGHTLDHIALFCPAVEQSPVLFCGDTLFAGGCGRVFEGDAAMMLTSLNKISALPAHTLVYCAHEYTLSNLAFALAVEPNNNALIERHQQDQSKREQQLPTVPALLQLELDTNPFLRCQQPAVIASAKQKAGDCNNDIAVFAAIRSWKDCF